MICLWPDTSGKNAFSFNVDFQRNGSVVPSRGPSPTFTRPDAVNLTATTADNESKVIKLNANEVKMVGQRPVRNILTAPNDFTNAAWLKTNSGTGSIPVITPNTVANPVDGAITASTVVMNRGAGNTASDFSQLIQNAAGVIVGNIYTGSVWLRGVAGEQVLLTQVDGFGSPVTITFTGGWQRLASVARVAASTGFQLINRGGFTTTNSITFNIYFAQQEDVTGQSVTAPAELVIGFRYFPWLNGNTVSSNVVTESMGALISTSINRGVLIEQAATNIIALADVRDMTTANWTLGATMTRARNQVGWDGVANTATLLTGGAVATTNRITYLVTAAASSRTFSLGLKRGVGVGPILITQDNFATSTDISSQLNSTTFTKVALNQSQLNAVLGLQISTNGDTVIADFNEFIAGDTTGVFDSRINDVGATRALDSLPYTTTGWYNQLAFTMWAEFLMPAVPVGATMYVYSLNDGTANNVVSCYLTNPAGTVTTNFEVRVGGVQQTLRTINSPAANTVVRVAFCGQANDFIGVQNGVLTAAGASGSMPTVTQLQVGNQLNANYLGNPIQEITGYPSRLPNSVAQNLIT